ncbi:LysR substrate-binding domain-containing protein [Hyalangium versicolor]|uniref:LysR substrate-binding domain-containing protein n=1 Tax=Hyalangium versicolor TaxID=2861190 RepID=UPI001CC98DAE|nr:LysR substrate-binding domain-containing protein [Hyalangium versicolor]
MMWAPHPFTLRQLQYVVAVADALSFRKAAALCHVSQPSLSAQLAQLEEALGVRIFERDRRRVLLTQAGKELVERARQLLVEADDLTEAARRASDPLSGTLRLGVIPTVSPYLLPTIAPALRKAFPRLTLLWVEDKTETLVHALGTGSLDAALVALEAELGDVEHEVIAEDPFVLAMAPGHPLGARKSEAPHSELQGADVLLLDEGHCFREQALAFCSKARAHELEFRATSLSTLTQMIAAGAGVTLLPRLAVPTEVSRSKLQVRPLAAPVPKRTLALIWRKRSSLQTALRQVAATVRSAYPKA